jgi:uncharacterized protein YutD
MACDYLKKSKGYEQNLLAFFHNNMNPDAMLVKLIEELDRCILSYFSFHWHCAAHVITQVCISIKREGELHTDELLEELRYSLRL